MKTIVLQPSEMKLPNIAVGCMRLNRLSPDEIREWADAAMALGANCFDHADCYGDGECESLFARAMGMSPSLREKMILQTKCGIGKGCYDLSKEHIIQSVEGSLKRLQTDYLDILLLHRPDALTQTEEVAAAFQALYDAGKVRHFGVSNHTPMQIELLQRAMDLPLEINQIQFSLAHAYPVAQGMNMNNVNPNAFDRDGAIIDYCRLRHITVQAWSPLQTGFFGGCFIDHPDYPELNRELDRLAQSYGVQKESIAMAWITRHPADIQPVTGTVTVSRLVQCLRGSDIPLTREEWYALYRAAGNALL